jgi:hypothetical protein
MNLLKALLMEDWGQLLLLILQGVLAWVIWNQRIRMKNAETKAKNAEATAEQVKRRHDNELEKIRAENAETMALVKLRGDQISATQGLTTVINEQNKILTLQGKQHSDAMTLFADSNAASIQLSEKIADHIISFQSFSKEQHAMTRATVGDASQTVIDSVEKGLENTRADIAAVAKDVQDVKRIVESLTPCPDELMVKLDRIELHLMSIEQQVPEKPKLDIEPIEPKPDIAPPAPADDNALDKSA